jgi:hypothetical protein
MSASCQLRSSYRHSRPEYPTLPTSASGDTARSQGNRASHRAVYTNLSRVLARLRARHSCTAAYVLRLLPEDYYVDGSVYRSHGMEWRKGDSQRKEHKCKALEAVPHPCRYRRRSRRSAMALGSRDSVYSHGNVRDPFGSKCNTHQLKQSRQAQLEMHR